MITSCSSTWLAGRVGWPDARTDSSLARRALSSAPWLDGWRGGHLVVPRLHLLLQLHHPILALLQLEHRLPSSTVTCASSWEFFFFRTVGLFFLFDFLLSLASLIMGN